MYAVNSIVLRVCIVLGMVAAVVTILYFTPMPDHNFHSCDRPCHDLDWPMICRVKLTLENQQTTTSQTSFCHSHNCTLGARERFVVNNQTPGPPIQICQNDILVVDVINKIPGHSTTLHWRGQPQNEAPTMDGVPMITQCPISSYTTFQYKFRASAPGTHLWHAYSGAEIAGGIFGALIVRHPHKTEPHKKLYDVDDKNHVIVISEWGNLLINGKGPPEASLFHVKQGRRYRFRIVYAGAVQGCPVTLSIEHHVLKVIALDGNAINPYEVSSVALSVGERLDFILKTIHPIGKYGLKLNAICNGQFVETQGTIKYDIISDEAETATNKTDLLETTSVSNRKFNTSFCESALGRVCLTDVRSLESIPRELLEDVDKSIYLGFEHRSPVISIDYKNREFQRKIYTTNNITFTYPSSPLLTQIEDVPQGKICNSVKRPEQCTNKEFCECVHIEEIPLGATVELVMFDTGADSEEIVLHLHGYRFYVVGYTHLEKQLTYEEAEKLDKRGLLFKRNFANPVLKDTIRIPKFGAVAVRFIANNPGYWILRDENSWQWSRGLDVVLKVGDSCDIVAKPSNFPMCGSWVGPDFFLT